jgi:DNA invertase Pin-like site-specific DNA recombinase
VIVGYVRVSTNTQAEEGLGLEVQERALRAWARSRQVRLGTIYRDEGQSGSNGIESRVGLADALERLRSGRAKGLVVYRLDRLARDLVLQEQLLAELRRYGAEVHSTAAGESAFLKDDPEDPSRALIRQVLGAVAQYERAMITLRLRSGRMRKAAKGGYAHGAPRLGYRAEGRALVPNPEEQRVVERVRELHTEGLSLRGIAKALEDEDLKPKRSDRWHPETVRLLIRKIRSGTT